ncbi:MAG: acyl-ACP--UDP-N-acetylglucosamine O-acyltransferase [Acidobacteriota bacterium]
MVGAGERTIHPSALVSRRAELADDVEVGPFAIIGGDVRIGRGCVIGPYVQIDRWTSIGENNRFFRGCTIGNPSKDVKYGGWRSYARIGDRNVFRESVSVSRSSLEEGATLIGDDNLLMNWVSISHDAAIGNRIIMANLVTVGGHVVVEDDARLGAQAAFHPFVRVGRMAMAGGCSKFTRDVPPFTVADGHPARVRGLNLVGLRSSRVNPLSALPPETLRRLKKAYRILFRSGIPLRAAIDRVRREIEPSEEVDHLLRFLEGSKRGIAT